MRRFIRIVSQILLGSLVATRTGAVPVPDQDLEAKVRNDWRKVRQETQRDTLRVNLSEEVRQYLPGEGEWQLDLPTSIRLSYAAAKPSDFKALDEYWSGHPGLLSDPDAQSAFEETRNWLAGRDGQIERAETRRPTEIAFSARLAPLDDLVSPFDFTWPAVSDRDDRNRNIGRRLGRDADDGDDDDDDDDYTDDQG